MSRKRIFVVFVVLIIVGAGVYFLPNILKKEPVLIPEPDQEETIKIEPIGKSVEGRDIIRYTYGNGDKHLVFVGAIHGGYEWNSALLSYELIDYLDENPNVIPDNIKVTVIPVLNPDGLYKILGTAGRFNASSAPPTEQTTSGRFNANEVDLNRNFDCNWQETGTWRGEVVSTGTSAFSEPEARAFRDFVLEEKPVTVVMYHSASNAIYGSECNEGILPETLAVMSAYSKSTGYPAIKSFDAYPVSGDVEGWLAKMGIPSITVELATHETVEWEKNKLGILALFEHYE